MAECLCLSSCATDELVDEPLVESGQALAVVPAILPGEQHQGSGYTRAGAKADTDDDIAQGDLVAARDERRENFLASLDVFVRQQGNTDTWFRQYHLTADDEAAVTDDERYVGKSLLNEAEQLLARNWTTEGYRPGQQYDVYVSANNPHTASDLASQQALFCLSTYEGNVCNYYYKPQDSDGSDAVGSLNRRLDERAFLMDGKIEGWTPDGSEGKQVMDVTLRRACAKIVVNLSYDGEHPTVLKVGEADGDEPEHDENGRLVYVSLKDYLKWAQIDREPGVPRWKYVNFGFRTADIADGSYTIDLDDSGDESSASALKTFSRNYNAEKWATDTDKTNLESNYQIVTYSFPTDWSTNRNKAPYVLLSIAYTKRGNPSNYQVNYYRIPVCDESKVTRLERNNIYIVDVSIASMGAKNESLELEDEQLRIEYHTIPWTVEDIDQEAKTTKVNVTDTKYFMVTPTSYTLQGDGTQTTTLNYFASVSADDNRIVDIDESSLSVSYVNYQGSTVNIRGTVSKTTAADGTITLVSQAPTTTADGERLTLVVKTDGTIQVSSEALASRAVKDIAFTVNLSNTVFSQRVTLRHFPLDNIQGIAGSWASRLDGSGGTIDKWVDWERDNGKTYTAANAKYTRDSGGHFYAKVYNESDGKIYGIAVTRSGRNNNYSYTYGRANSQSANSGNYYYAEGGTYAQMNSNMTSLNNNMMYVIQSTSTSQDYVIGRPVIDANYQSQDKVVSPAFMIASQLGANTPFTVATEAAALCGTYVEVGTDGTRYTGWRLPTRDEVGFIAKYQKDPKVQNVNIRPVLTGDNYWTLEGKAVATGYNTTVDTWPTWYKDTSRDTNSGNVRCIRDLSLDEIKKLNGE